MIMNLTQHILGHSVQGRPIVAFGPATLPDHLHWLWVGGFHGDEPQSVNLLDAVLTQLSLPNDVLVIPCLNIDGLAAQTRVNANGVDLNRNYPTANFEVQGQDTPYYGGLTPGSEPETRLLMRLIEQTRPQGLVSVHTPYRFVNFDGPADHWATLYSQHSGYPVEPSMGYPTPGSFGTWAGLESQIPLLTVELPDNDPLDKLIIDNLPAFQALIQSV